MKQSKQDQIQSQDHGNDNAHNNAHINIQLCEHKQSRTSHSHKPAINVSQYYAQYKNILNTVPSNIAITHQQLLSQLLKNPKIQYKPFLQFHNKISINLIRTDYQSIQLQLFYGYLSLKIKILNLVLEYQFKGNQSIDAGQFGTIYQCINYIYGGELENNGENQCINQEVIVKVICMDSYSQNISQAIYRIYSEYFIMYIAGEIQAGPEIKYAFGYDIVFLNKYAFFSMEKCVTLDNKRISQMDRPLLQQLKYSLKQLHMLGIVHFDIKPQNICWSRTKQKYIFIDFGLSMIKQQKPGSKIITNFKGTYLHCYQQMRKLFLLRGTGLVDVYYNDAYGLEQVIKNKFKPQNLEIQLEKSNIQWVQEYSASIKKSDSQRIFLENLMKITKIKYEIYKSNIQKVLQIINQQDQMLKSCLQILNKSITPLSYNKNLSYNSNTINYSINPYINKIDNKNTNLSKNIQQQIKQKIIQRDHYNYTNKIDELLAQYIQNLNSDKLISYLIPIQLNTRKQINWTQDILKDKRTIEHLYFLINPQNCMLSKSHKNRELLTQNTRFIIETLYKFLQKQQTSLFIKKFRRICLFYLNFFKQLQNKYQLQSLALLFCMIKDQANAVKARQFVLQILMKKGDQLEYYVKYAKFYMLSQKRMYHYMYNICEKYFDVSFNANGKQIREQSQSSSISDQSSVNDNKNKQYQKHQLTDLIKQAMNKFIDFIKIYIATSNLQQKYEKLQQMNKQFIIILQKSMKYQMYVQEINIIIKQFDFIRNNFIKQFQNHAKFAHLYQKNAQILKQYLTKYPGQISITYGFSIDQGHFTASSYQINGAELIDRLIYEQDISKIIQICDFCYQLCQGDKTMVIKSFFVRFWQKIHHNQSLLLNLIDNQYKWIKTIKQKLYDYACFQRQLMTLYQINKCLYLTKNPTLTTQQITHCSTLNKHLLKSYKHYSTTLPQKTQPISSTILKIICSIQTISTNWLHEPTASIAQIQQILSQLHILIKHYKQNNQLQYQQSLSNLCYQCMIDLLLQLRKNYYYNLQYINKTVREIYQNQDVLTGVMRFKELLYDLIGVYVQEKCYLRGFYVLDKEILKASYGSVRYTGQTLIQILAPSINLFCESTPQLQLIKCLKISLQKISLYTMHSKSGIFSYTLFTILSRTYSFINPFITNRTLKLICYGMKNLTYTSLSIIKSLLYVIYCDSNDVKYQENIMLFQEVLGLWHQKMYEEIFKQSVYDQELQYKWEQWGQNGGKGLGLQIQFSGLQNI